MPQDRRQGSPYRSRAVGLLTQAAVLLLVGGLVAIVAHNTAQNLRTRGIASGFAFLKNPAGFDITMHLISYDEAQSYGRAFVVALLNTLVASGLGIVCATLLGFALGIMRLSPNWLLSRVAATYVELVRNLPLVLQLFFLYFAVLRAAPGPRQSMTLGGMIFFNVRGLFVPRPIFGQGMVWVFGSIGVGLGAWLFLRATLKAQQRPRSRPFPHGLSFLGLGVLLPTLTFILCGAPLTWEVPQLSGFNFQGGLNLIPELVALVTALTLYTAAFIAEIVRAGILSVPRGQTEAALALGLSPLLVLRLVVIPQAMRVIVPPLTSQYLNLTKNSSLAAAIAYPDLMLVFAGTVLMQTGQAVEIIAMTMAVYLIISLTISLFMNRYARRSLL